MYYTYLIPERIKLKYAVADAYFHHSGNMVELMEAEVDKGGHN